jgi:hypothetical protein
VITRLVIIVNQLFPFAFQFFLDVKETANCNILFFMNLFPRGNRLFIRVNLPFVLSTMSAPRSGSLVIDSEPERETARKEKRMNRRRARNQAGSLGRDKVKGSDAQVGDTVSGFNI